MRLVVLALASFGGSLAATPAQACPAGARCVRADAPRDEVAPAPKRAIRSIDLRVELRDTRPAWRLDIAEKPAADEMPWLWQVLRREVYAQMPRYRDESFTFVLSPVVIAGSFDTVPGVGLAGDF